MAECDKCSLRLDSGNLFPIRQRQSKDCFVRIQHGETGTYSLAFTYPSLFSRIALLSENIKITDANVAALKGLPI